MLEKECWAILNKPKPRVELPKDAPIDTSKKQPPTSSSKKSSPSKNQNQKSNDQQTSMEID
jgi:hypothetical protein